MRNEPGTPLFVQKRGFPRTPNAGDLSICHLPYLGLNPFVIAPFGEPWLSGSWLLGSIVYDSTEFFENILKDADGFFWIIRSKHRSLCGKSHDGIFELWLSWFGVERLGERHKGSGYHRHNHGRKEFLKDAIVGITVEFLDFQDYLFVSIVGFDFPTSEIQSNNVLRWECCFVIKVGEQDGDGSVRADQFDNPELNGLDLFSLFLGNLVQVVAAWVNTDLVFVLSAPDEGLYRGKRGSSRTAKYEIVPGFLGEMANQPVARVSSVKEQDTSRRDKFQEVTHLITLGRIGRNHGSCDGNASEDIVRGRDKTLRIVAFSRILEPALGIECHSELGSSRKVVFGSVYAVNRHGVPAEFWVLGPAVVGQFDSVIEYVSKYMPRNLLTRLGKRAVVDCLGFRPKTTSFGCSKEFTGFHVHSFGFSTGRNGEEKRDKFWKREFSVSGKICGCALLVGWDFLGNNSEKTLGNVVKLA